MVMMPRRSCEGRDLARFGWEGMGRGAYEEADDPCFDDGQVGGEDGEPGHGGRSRRVVES